MTPLPRDGPALDGDIVRLPLARERCRVRSLGAFCWPKAFGENPFARCFPRAPFAKPDGSDCRRVGETLTVSPEPSSECGSRIRARRIGDPRRGSPTAKLSAGQILPTLLRFAYA